MRKLILSFLALCFMATTAFAVTKAGDKVYFVNTQDWENFYAQENLAESPWTELVASTPCTYEGWNYDGHKVYSYVIANDGASITINNGTIWTSGSAELDGGRVYTIGTNDTYYWLTASFYYYEFYFIQTTFWYNGPKIVLYNSKWQDIHGVSWAGELMEPVGSYSNFPVWKFVGLTSEPCYGVRFMDGQDANNKIDAVLDTDASKNCYHWQAEDNIWRTLPALDAVKYTIVGDWKLLNDGDHSADWAPGNAYNVMGYNSTTGKYELTIYPDINEAKAFSYSVLFNNSWDYHHVNEYSTMHEWVTIPVSGHYTVTFEYDPSTDELTANAELGNIFDYYSRYIQPGWYGTICLPKASSSYSGATFYTVVGKDGSDIVLEEVEGQLEAGKPYLYYPTITEAEGNLIVEQTGDAAASAGSHNGLIGSFTTHAIDAYNGSSCYNFILKSNEWHSAAADAVVGACRAYLDLDAVPAIGGASLAPGKKYARMSINGRNAPTMIDEVEDGKWNEESFKTIENGQLIIIKNGVKYNVMGQTIK